MSAKKQTLMGKLKKAFVDPLKWERFELHGFHNGLTVTSFRAAHMTPDQVATLEKVKELLAAEEAEEQATVATKGSTGIGSAGSPGNMSLSPAASSPRASPAYSTLPMTTAEGEQHADPEASKLNKSQHATSSSVKSQLEKAEERKRERIERRKGMQQLLARNPQHLPPNPRELAAILRAQNHMGDYRLKTSADYDLPEHLQPTAQRKAIQLILLEYSIHQLRCEFNERVIQLRDVKRSLCERMNTDKRRIREICDTLRLDFDDSPYALRREEEPEKRFEIDNAGLEKFGEEMEKAKKKREALERAKKGFGSDLATMEDEEEPTAARRRQSIAAGVSAAGGAGGVNPGAPLGPKEKFELDLRARQEAIRKSDLEEEEWLMLKEQLLYERSRLERHIRRSIESFDESLDELYHEKLKLESDLCMADMRVLLLFREYLLLLDFKQRDKELAERRKAKQKEYNEVSAKRQQRAELLDGKRQEMAQVDAVTVSLKAEYDEMVADMSDAARAALEGVYLRKIKRRRPEDDEDDDDESSSDDDDEEEDEDWAEEGDDTCPPGIDEPLFHAVLAVRSRRLDQVDRKNDISKVADALKKEHDQLKRDEAETEKQLKRVTKDEEDFKREKQKQLNQLETIVVLKQSQVRCLDENRKLPPVYTDNYVVFTQGGLQQLQQRIVDLGKEKEQLEVEARQLDVDMGRLSRKRAKRYAEYQEWDAKVYEVQLLKFGQRVNLEMLENVAVDRETEELKAQLKAEEIRWERELNKQNDRLQSLKLQQQQRIAENTASLKDLGSYRAEQRDLEQALQESAGKIVAKMTGGSKVATAADRAHLKDLVVAQQQEVDALKNEIAMLRRKGGHVYTPVVNKVSPPPPHSA
jgi:hypothetical protein